ncbi:adenylyl-sulfate kinase [Vibrio sp. 10N.286.49.C2]|uniref:adenylyl-sulfate kinase n=1 Tax=unclassified Vibrio TaxID=2614977 RepID=UPI000C81AAC0|nr:MULTISPECIES: adenylyl-sulfate kinase [unclassified Vibrio]PMH40179.1 adenylyl-sulfate kinase [Vibrio sp. 10N.286.49.C2]PMH46368.1 adenylyl-sulfate kinase [Vibrio sp. 10N.286.49.B1]
MSDTTLEKDENVIWHQHYVTKSERSELKKQQPVVLWFTGLSGAGKSTVAGALETELIRLGHHTYLLDGDNVRHGLCRDLGFSAQDRRENIRRVGELAKLMADAGLIVLSAFISPHREERALVKSLLPKGEFLEVFVDASLAVCESRDPKGLYKKARAGEIANFTGIDSKYEQPLQPDIHLQASDHDVATLVTECLAVLKAKNIIA